MKCFLQQFSEDEIIVLGTKKEWHDIDDSLFQLENILSKKTANIDAKDIKALRRYLKKIKKLTDSADLPVY